MVPCASSPVTHVSHSPLRAEKARRLRKRQLWFSVAGIIRCLFIAWYSLSRRRSLTSVSNVCEAAPVSLLWGTGYPADSTHYWKSASNFLSSRLANRQWHFKQTNDGAYSNRLGTQVGAKSNDFGAVSRTDCVCSAKCGRKIPGIRPDLVYRKRNLSILASTIPRLLDLLITSSLLLLKTRWTSREWLTDDYRSGQLNFDKQVSLICKKKKKSTISWMLCSAGSRPWDKGGAGHPDP